MTQLPQDQGQGQAGPVPPLQPFRMPETAPGGPSGPAPMPPGPPGEGGGAAGAAGGMGGGAAGGMGGGSPGNGSGAPPAGYHHPAYGQAGYGQPYGPRQPYGGYQPYPGHPPGATPQPGRDPALAEWWQRLLARLIDGLVLTVLTSPLWVRAFLVFWRRIQDLAVAYPYLSPAAQQAYNQAVARAVGTFMLAGVAVAVISFGYDWFQHGLWGQTIGKRVMRTKVVTADTRGRISAGGARGRGLRPRRRVRAGTAGADGGQPVRAARRGVAAMGPAPPVPARQGGPHRRRQGGHARPTGLLVTALSRTSAGSRRRAAG
jgi:uncharacterized RDD family membrane protein YckC